MWLLIKPTRVRDRGHYIQEGMIRALAFECRTPAPKEGLLELVPLMAQGGVAVNKWAEECWLSGSAPERLL